MHILAIVQKDVFTKLVSIILKSFENYKIFFLQLQIKQKSDKEKDNEKYCFSINYRLYNIPIGNVEKLVPNFFDKEQYVLHYEILQLNWRPELKLKKMHGVLELNESQSNEFKTKKNKNRKENCRAN